MSHSRGRIRQPRHSRPAIDWEEVEQKVLLGSAGLLALAYLLASPLGLRGPLFVNLEGWGLLDFPGLLLLRLLSVFGVIGVASISMWLARPLSFVFFLLLLWLLLKAARDAVELARDDRLPLVKRALVVAVAYIIAGAMLRGVFYAVTGVGEWGIGRGGFQLSFIGAIVVAFAIRRALVALSVGTLLALAWQSGRPRWLLYLLGALVPPVIEIALLSSAIPLWFRSLGPGLTQAAATLLPPFAAGTFAALFCSQWSEETTPSYY